MGLQAMDDFLGALEKRIPSDPDTQWTVDLQPQDLTEDLLYVLCDRHPVKAIRLELMAFSQRELLALHTPFTANLSEHALSFLTDHKETNRPFLLSVSLGIGIPGQSEDSFRKTLLRLLPAQPDQIVLKRFRNRRLSREEQLSLAEETDWSSYIRAAEEFLGSQGYLRSGNSLTFALPGRAFYADESDAKKMSQYGFGLGARTRLEGFSYANTDDYAFYVENSGNPELLIAH